MKKKTILLLALVCGLLTSCFKDDEVTFDDYCYISNVTLGTLKRWNQTTDSVGNPVPYLTSYSGSLFHVTIDQRTDTIQNRDSLLYNTDLRALLMTISFEGATLLYRPASDSTADWTAYNSKDSMNLRTPLHLLVVSNDGASNRIYTLKLNVHQQEGDSLSWSRRDSAVAELEGMEEMRALSQGGMLRVLGRVAQGVTLASRPLTGGEGQWTRESTNLPENAQVGTLCQMAGRLYMSAGDGALYVSDDALTWELLSSMGQNTRLAGASNSYLYALAGRSVLRSTDGQVWEREALDDDESFLPDTCLNILTFGQENGGERLVMVGYRSMGEDTTAVVWNKSWTAREQEGQAQWMFFTQTPENRWLCPRLQSLNVMPYDGRCLAFGGAPELAGDTRQAMDAMYFSRDYGLTWKPDYELHLPDALLGVSGPVASAVDNDKYIWIIANRQVWRGRINRLGFLRQ